MPELSDIFTSIMAAYKSARLKSAETPIIYTGGRETLMATAAMVTADRLGRYTLICISDRRDSARLPT